MSNPNVMQVQVSQSDSRYDSWRHAYSLKRPVEHNGDRWIVTDWLTASTHGGENSASATLLRYTLDLAVHMAVKRGVERTELGMISIDGVCQLVEWQRPTSLDVEAALHRLAERGAVRLDGDSVFLLRNP